MGRILTFALIIIGIGGLGLVGWVSFHEEPPAPVMATALAPPPPPPMVKVEAQPPPPSPPLRLVLVAASPLRAGNLLKPADLADQSMSADAVPPGASDSTPQVRSSLFGAMIRRSLAPGEPITAADIMRSGDHGFLAAVLQPGMRAMTLGADVIGSDVDLLWPGDHVDLILTQQIDPGKPAAPSRRVFGDVVLGDIRVLAIDQQLVEGASADQPVPKTARTITLEVAPDQAGRLAVAMRLGKLSFAVRAADRTSAAAVAGAATALPATTWAGDVAPGLGTDAPPPQSRVIRVWRGSSDSKEVTF